MCVSAFLELVNASLGYAVCMCILDFPSVSLPFDSTSGVIEEFAFFYINMGDSYRTLGVEVWFCLGFQDVELPVIALDDF